jgi:hypothetical protein
MANFKCIIPRNGNKDEHRFKTLAEPSMNKIGGQLLQVFDKDPKQSESIFKKYQAGLKAAIDADLKNEDIVVLMHSDVSIVDNLFREKVELIFNEKTDVGLLGVIGTTELTDRGGWWMQTPDKMFGHILQGKEGQDNQGFHLQKGAIGYFDEIIGIDGCIMITTGKFIKEGLRFDDQTYTGNDFYDLDLCLNVSQMGYKIAVADILIYHASTGRGVFTDDWKNAKDIFLKKWTDKGFNFPLTRSQFPYKKIESEIVEISL